METKIQCFTLADLETYNNTADGFFIYFFLLNFDPDKSSPPLFCYEPVFSLKYLWVYHEKGFFLYSLSFLLPRFPFFFFSMFIYC